LAEFYRLAALEQYREIMWDGAADEVPAGPLDFPAVLTHEPTEPPGGRHEIKFDYGKLTSRSVSQQSAFYLPRLAPGSQTRKWEFGVLDRETKERLQSELWRKSREKEGK
jgi:hypothetical protein